MYDFSGTTRTLPSGPRKNVEITVGYRKHKKMRLDFQPFSSDELHAKQEPYSGSDS